jgi:hypothetical protein
VQVRNERKTREVSDALGVPMYQLTNLIVRGRIPRPRKDASGDFWWSSGDIERARQALATPYQRRRQAVG